MRWTTSHLISNVWNLILRDIIFLYGVAVLISWMFMSCIFMWKKPKISLFQNPDKWKRPTNMSKNNLFSYIFKYFKLCVLATLQWTKKVFWKINLMLRSGKVGCKSALLTVLLHGAAQKRHSWATEKDNCLPGGSCCQPFGEVWWEKVEDFLFFPGKKHPLEKLP